MGAANRPPIRRAIGDNNLLVWLDTASSLQPSRRPGRVRDESSIGSYSPPRRIGRSAYTPKKSRVKKNRRGKSETVHSHISFRVPPFGFVAGNEFPHVLDDVVALGAGSEGEKTAARTRNL